uniref:SBP-type domain-containing protein n=1 Tax=Tetradesmus obliquus TaxID=3088 RepID=A0A383V4L1_TETOB|eukprot:jgi/Sobl393_1/15342/SZX60557.1
MGSTDVQRMPSSKLKIKTVYFCQVDGCKSKLSNCKPYCVRYRVCPAHLAAAQVQLQGETSRFCQQCGKFHAIEEFDGNKRSCRTRLMHHNNSRQQRRKEAALQQSASTTLMLQHTGVRAAPGRRNTQPPAAAAAAEDTAAAAAGSEPCAPHGDASRQSADHNDGNSSQCATHERPAQQQQQQHFRNVSSSNTSSDSTPAASNQQEPSAADACAPCDTCTASKQQQQQQQQQQATDASGDASGLWDFFANQGPYAAAAAAATGGKSPAQGSDKGPAGHLHSQQQQQSSPASAATGSAVTGSDALDADAAGWPGDLAATGWSFTAASAPQLGMKPAAADAAWPSSMQQQLLQQLGCSASASSWPAVAQLQQLPAAVRPYCGSCSPANLPASACMAVQAAGAAAGSAPHVNAGAGQTLMTPDKASYQPAAARQHVAPAAAASPFYTMSGAAGSGNTGVYGTVGGSLPPYQPLPSAPEHTNSSGMQRAFSGSMSSGRSFGRMQLEPAAATAAAAAAYQPGLPSRSSFTTCTTAAGAAAAPFAGRAAAAAAGYHPAAAGIASAASRGGGKLVPAALAAAGLDLSAMCTVPGCTSCPPYTRIGGALSAWQDVAAAAAAAAAPDRAGYTMAYRGTGGPSSMPMDWQPAASNAAAATVSGEDWEIGWSGTSNQYGQAELQGQQCQQYQPWAQHPGAAVHQQYSQQSDHSRQYSEGRSQQYSSAADAAIAAAALAAAGSMALPTATVSTCKREELIFGVTSATPCNGFAAVAAGCSTAASAVGAAAAAAHVDVWSSLHQPAMQQTSLSRASYDAAHTVANNAATGPLSNSNTFYAPPPAAAAAVVELQRCWPSVEQSSHLPAALMNSKAPAAALAAAAAAGSGSQGILHGHPERLAAGVQGAACFGAPGSSAALYHISGVPTSAGKGPPLVLPGVPVAAAPADEHLAAAAGCGVSHNMSTHSRIPADAAGCDVSLFAHAHSLSAEALQARLLAQMSAAAATAAAQQQQQAQRQFIAEAAERVAFAAAPEQQGQLQPSTPHTANPVFHGSSPMNGLAASAAFPAASAAAAAAAPASMWQPAVDAAPAIMDATAFPAASAAPDLLANPQSAAATGCVGGDSSAGPNACVRGAGDSFGGGPCVRGAGDSFGGFCDVLLGSGRGLHELLQSWSAEGEAGEQALEGLALLPEDVDML